MLKWLFQQQGAILVQWIYFHFVNHGSQLIFKWRSNDNRLEAGLATPFVFHCTHTQKNIQIGLFSCSDYHTCQKLAAKKNKEREIPYTKRRKVFNECEGCTEKIKKERPFWRQPTTTNRKAKTCNKKYLSQPCKQKYASHFCCLSRNAAQIPKW